MFKKLFTPFSIGGCTIPNRLAVPAMVTNYCTIDGKITDRYIRYMEEKAKGGWGLLITEDFAIEEHGKGYPLVPGLYHDDQIEGCQKLTKTIHQYDSKIFCQLYHPGRQTNHLINGNVMPIAPSGTKDPICMDLARELTTDEIHEIVQAFGRAAGRAKESGFDGIELHGAHGYLIAQFLSSYVNKRTDQYGGCFENRARFLDEIVEAIRANVGPDFPVQIRISSAEYVTGGRTEAETYELARHCEEIGLNAIHVSNGVYASNIYYQIIATMYTEHAVNMTIAEQVKKVVDIPVIVTNRINDPTMADTLIMMDKADAVGMGRGSLADPHLPRKAQEGRLREINYCIGCLQGCQDGISYGMCSCLVNPRVGREVENDMNPAKVSKRVMVIGGGPGGLMAARTAAERGHKVTLYEASNSLGGQFKSAAYPPAKGELSTVISSYRENCEKLNVTIRLNTEVTEELIASEKPDAIVVATGAKPLIPPVKGIDLPNVATAEDVLLASKDIGFGPVVICGGGEVGGETAHYVSERNHDVTIVEMQDDILNDMQVLTKACLLDNLMKAGVKIKTGCKVSEITKDCVICEDKDGKTIELPADTVISAFGYRSYNPLETAARRHCDEVYVIGGAVKAGTALTANKEGYEAGLMI